MRYKLEVKPGARTARPYIAPALLQERITDPGGGFSVPEWGYPGGILYSVFLQNFKCGCLDLVFVYADQLVGAHFDGDRALGVSAQREAGNAEHGRFFLQPAAVRQH